MKRAERTVENAATVRWPLSLSRCAARSQINGRAENDDSFLICPLAGKRPVTLLAVADGMGGYAHGKDVSREALRRLALILFESLVVERQLDSLAATALPDLDETENFLRSAVWQVNEYVKRMIRQNEWDKAGTTLVAAVLVERVAVVVNLGDSPLLHLRGGELQQISEDHSEAGQLLSAGLLTPAQAAHHGGRHRLEFYLGAEQLPVELAVRRITLSKDDLLLLCSDGVSGRLAVAQIEAVLRKARSGVQRPADQLLKLARAQGETDNQTLILWRCA